MEKYIKFLKKLDTRLKAYFYRDAEHILCKKGCSCCCEKGDYPISELELKFLMKGYAAVENNMKVLIQKNISAIKKGEQCPFLINNMCSIYEYRPIVCRTHGLAYLCKEGVVKVPYCVNLGLNYCKVYSKEGFSAEPILENLDTHELLKGFDYGEVRNLYDWFK